MQSKVYDIVSREKGKVTLKCKHCPTVRVISTKAISHYMEGKYGCANCFGRNRYVQERQNIERRVEKRLKERFIEACKTATYYTFVEFQGASRVKTRCTGCGKESVVGIRYRMETEQLYGRRGCRTCSKKETVK